MSELVALSTEQTEEINKAEAVLNGAKNLVINNDLSFNTASHMLKKIKAKKKSLDDMRKDLKKPINQAGKKIEDMFRQPLNYLLQAEQAIKKSMLNYKDALDYKATVEQQDIQEQLQILELAAQKAINDNDMVAFQRITNDIHDLQNKNQLAPAIDGISYRDNWKGEGIDLRLAINAISAGKAPISIVKFDDVAINQLAKSTKGTISYPGIRLYNDKIIAAKGG